MHVQRTRENAIRVRIVWLFVVALALGIFLSVPHADAQRPAKVPRLGVLGLDSSLAPERVAVFHEGLRALGYVEGRNMTIEYRWAEGRVDRLPALAAELVRLRVDVLVTIGGNLVVRAAQQATTTTPIVAPIMNDPVAAGFVASLARPGGNITGQAFQDTELIPKQVELLREAVPRLSRLAVLWHPAGSGARVVRAAEEAAQAVGLQLHAQEVREPPDLDRAVAASKAWGAQALLQLPSPFFHHHRKPFVALLTTHQLPAMCETRPFAVEGCLMVYGVSFEAMFRRMAYYVDRILKGAKAADLPVEQPREFDFVINLKTGKGLALKIAPSLLLRADQLIQ